MRKVVAMVLITMLCFGSLSFANNELQEAVTWMYGKGLTSFEKAEDFNAEGELTREQASKFFVQFAKQVLSKKVDESLKVDLKDLKDADKGLQTYIQQSNQLGLFKGSEGNFYPFNKLTRAQALAVLIRARNGLQNETDGKRYTRYYDIANEYGIISGLGFDFGTMDSLNIKRKEIAIMLFRLSKINKSIISEVPIKPSVSKSSTGEIITKKCLEDRPTDFSIRAYCEKTQYEGIDKLNMPKPSYIDEASFKIIKEECAQERPIDFSTRAYCEKTEFEGVQKLQLPKPTDIDDKSYSIIMNKCEQERPRNFSTRAYCVNMQYDGVRNLK